MLNNEDGASLVLKQLESYLRELSICSNAERSLVLLRGLVLGRVRLRLQAGKVRADDLEEAHHAAGAVSHARVRALEGLGRINLRLLRLHQRSRLGGLRVEVLEHVQGGGHRSLGLLRVLEIGRAHV